MAKIFKVVKTVWVDEVPNADEKNKPLASHTKVKTLETVSSGLTWEDAKKLRKETRTGEIFPE